MPPQLQAIAFFWIRREDYVRLREICVDGSNLPETYEKWFYAANKGIEHMKRRGGIEVMRATVNLDEFVSWCRAKGLNIDAKARTEYASYVAASQIFSRDENKH